MTPQVNRAILTTTQQDFFVANGYLILKNVVTPEQIAEATAFLEGSGYQGTVGGADYRQTSSDSVRACINDTVLGALADLFGPEYPFPQSRDASDMPRPQKPDGRRQPHGFHVDDDYPTVMPAGWAIGLFLFLTRVQHGGGAFHFAPGSHLAYRTAMADRPESLTAIAGHPALHGATLEFLAEPGDLLLFSHLLCHSGSENVTDPATRHALLARFHPYRRIVPGNKNFAEMSPLEKANSNRYWRAQGKGIVATPSLTLDAATDHALQSGFGDGFVLAHTCLQVQGAPCFVFVTEAAPDRLQVASSPDLVYWTTHLLGSLPFASASTLHHYERTADITLFVGENAREGQTLLFHGQEISELAQAESLLNCPHASGYYTTRFGSKIAYEQVLFSLSADHPNEVLCRWGADWQQAAAAQVAVAAVLPPDHTIRDAFVRPTLSEALFALVLDVAVAETPETRPYVARSSDSARYTSPPEPLAYTAPTPPHQIRVYSRARNYWLVTYLRVVSDEAIAAVEQRIYWGILDWEKTPLQLEEISTAQQMQEAFCTVGFL